MTASELMIGDWLEVQDTPKYYKVFGIEEMSRGNACRLIYEDWIVDTWCDRVKPITLTEEILKENGWWNDEDMNDETTRFMFYRYKDYVITFVSHSGLPVLTIDHDDQSDCRTKIQLVDEVYNVHELQHALRLCGLNELADNFVIEKGGIK